MLALWPLSAGVRQTDEESSSYDLVGGNGRTRFCTVTATVYLSVAKKGRPTGENPAKHGNNPWYPGKPHLDRIAHEFWPWRIDIDHITDSPRRGRRDAAMVCNVEVSLL